jgi:rhamnosyltransferase
VTGEQEVAAVADIRPDDVAAVVVLYRPGAEALSTISSYGPSVGRVYAVDNTETPEQPLLEALSAVPNAEYVPMSGNEGLGSALNAGVQRALAAGYAWVLTMDQDSTPDGAMLRELSRCASECSEQRAVGLVSPLLRLENGPDETGFVGCRNALTTITSGSLLSVGAWTAVGGFDETLFIDQVDHELCLRLQAAGFAVLECGSAWLSHRMGEMSERRLLGPVFVSNHSALRRYYITRNRLAVSKRYRTEFPEFHAREMSALRHELLKVVLLEDHKAAKLLMSWRGYRDYRRGVSGPYGGPPVRNGA